MRRIFRYIESIAPTGRPALVTGETGVGKELIARAIHRLGQRTGPFVAVNVAGIDDVMFADTLFGHRRGAFSGAVESRAGAVSEAAAGTLLLDEIGDLSFSSQVKLLRLLQEGEYQVLGSDVKMRAQVGVIATTNQDLEVLVSRGIFRRDLYY